jgi:hypothetical protein
MVFYFRTSDGHEPTTDDCRAVHDAYGQWESYGFFLGYFVHRGDDSYFTGSRTFGIGEPPRASYITRDTPAAGVIPSEIEQLLPTAVAPIIRWATAERGPRTGRTYAVGLTTLTSDPNPDMCAITGPYAAILVSTFDSLRSQVQALTGFIQCHYTRSPRGGVGPGDHLLDITGCGVYELMGTQRRRTRP